MRTTMGSGVDKYEVENTACVLWSKKKPSTENLVIKNTAGKYSIASNGDVTAAEIKLMEFLREIRL